MPKKRTREQAELEIKTLGVKNGDCLDWPQVKKHSKGYAFIVTEGREYYAHRFAFEVAHGPIPKGLCVCHRCDNRRCVNLDHLFLGTYHDNTQDMMKKGRHRPNPPHGDKNGRSCLRDEQVVEIRRLRSEGWETRALATKFNRPIWAIRYAIQKWQLAA